MKFTYVPILDMMIEFYKKPRDPQVRFLDWYLKLIQTPDKKDMMRPLPYFNPMGKEHVLEKLQNMKEMGFEDIMKNICSELSNDWKELQVYFNLADDVAWSWTDRNQTHEMSQKVRPFITRWFCVVVFYASDDITAELIEKRVKFYADIYNNYR